MMNIVEFFANLYRTAGFDAACEVENAVWAMSEREDGSFESWATANNVDLTAVIDGISALQRWAWEFDD